MSKPVPDAKKIASFGSAEDKCTMTTLLVATRNPHKVMEIRTVLGDDYSVMDLRDYPTAPTVAEDAATFAGNARKKSEGLAQWLRGQAQASPQSSSWWVLADDSGLEVDALGGAPGVHSARFAALDRGQGGNSQDSENNDKLLRLLAHVPAEQRQARFHCWLALTPVESPMMTGQVAPSAETETRLFEGVCAGRIGFAPRGTHGFGYDPLFLPWGYEQSFAELGEETKNQISHRAQALARLQEYLVGRNK
jgi:XTP/dITP diphosphohydrolase